MNDIDDFLGFGADTVDKTNPNGDLVTSGEVAEWIGLTTSRVSQLARDRILPRSDTPGPHDRTGYPLKAVVRAYTEYPCSGQADGHVHWHDRAALQPPNAAHEEGHVHWQAVRIVS
jgi:hypothetical protein